MPDIEQNIDLTGTWKGNDGSVTYLRQVTLGSGTQIFWASTNVFSPVFSNIFTGYLLGSSIVGQWVDVPQTFQDSIGVLSLQVIDPMTIQQVSSSLAYNTRIWTKIRSGFPTEVETKAKGGFLPEA
ncbi:hypothetical protein UT300005_14150 [Clostridium sp. CTA-5]